MLAAFTHPAHDTLLIVKTDLKNFDFLLSDMDFGLFRVIKLDLKHWLPNQH